MTMLKDGVATVTDNGGDSRPTDVALRCVIDDIDDIAASLNSVFYPAKVNRLRNTPQAAAELVATRLKRLTIGRVRFGNAVELHAGDLGCRHVNIRLTGSVVSRTGDQESVAPHDHAAAFTQRARRTSAPEYRCDPNLRQDRVTLPGTGTRPNPGAPRRSAGAVRPTHGPRLCATLVQNDTVSVVFAHLIGSRRPVDTAAQDDTVAFATAHHLSMYTPSLHRRSP